MAINTINAINQEMAKVLPTGLDVGQGNSASNLSLSFTPLPPAVFAAAGAQPH